MSFSDEFYSHFPSLNSNSKENQRYKRISNEYTEYLKNRKPPNSPQKTKQQKLRSRISKENVPSPSSSNVSSPSMDVIFSAEDRNRYEDEQKEARRKTYQIGLQHQIEDQRQRKKAEADRRKHDEIVLEQRLQKQLESIKLQKDPLADKIVERISLSENEKESYNDKKLSQHNTSSDNKVYRYFSQSAGIDSDLFNYKKYFNDMTLEQNKNLSEHHFTEAKKPAKPSEVALNKKVDTPKKPIDICQSCTNHAECSRCHKKLEMFCKQCNEDAQVSPEVTNHLQLEYNEPELNISKDQQVVVYRSSDQHAPYSFNIEPNSMFYKDTLEDMRQYSEMKLSNYMKHYGDLRKTKLDELNKLDDTMRKKLEERPRQTGAIPKQKPISNNIPKSRLQIKPSELDDILSSAQYTVITQIGFAKKQLEMERYKH